MRTMRERKQSQFNEGSDEDLNQQYHNASPNKKVMAPQEKQPAQANATFSPQKVTHNGRQSSDVIQADRTTMVSNSRAGHHLTHNYSGERIGTDIDHQMMVGKDFKGTTASFPEVKVTKKLGPNNTIS